MNGKIIVGCFGKPYGVKGWITVHAYTETPQTLLKYPHWIVNHQDHWLEMTPEDGKAYGNGLIVKLSNIDDRDQIQSYTNNLIAVPRETLPTLAKGEYYEIDLIGLQVINLKGISLGLIDSILPTGANDVFIVKSKTKEHLIPYTDVVVKSIDIDKKLITVDWDPDY